MRIVPSADRPAEFDLPYLKGLSTFGALSDQAIQALLDGGKVVHLKNGEALYDAGKKVNEFYIQLSGQTSFYRNFRDMPTHVRTYVKGEQIGFAGMIALHNRKGTVVADQNSYVLEISSDQFFELHESSPQDFGILLLNLSRELARSVGNQADLIVELSERLAD